MRVPCDAMLLRVFVGERDRHGGKPLYEAIVLTAREAGLAGATVTRGVLGFGRSSRLHTAKILRLSDELPMVVEIVDAEDRIRAFLPTLDGLMDRGSGLVLLERAEVVRYGDTER
jgi:hypothetical protein